MGWVKIRKNLEKYLSNYGTFWNKSSILKVYKYTFKVFYHPYILEEIYYNKNDTKDKGAVLP